MHLLYVFHLEELGQFSLNQLKRRHYGQSQVEPIFLVNQIVHVVGSMLDNQWNKNHLH